MCHIINLYFIFFDIPNNISNLEFIALKKVWMIKWNTIYVLNMCAIELLYWFSNIRYWSPAMGVASSKLSTENSIIGMYMFLRKFHKIEMKADLDADEIWRSVWLGLFLRWVKIFTIQIKIFIHQKHTSIAKLWLDPSDMTDAPVVKPDSELIQDVVLPVDLILVTPFRSKSPVLRCFFNLSPWKKEDKLD